MRLAVGALVPIRAARSFRRSGAASASSTSAIRCVAVIARAVVGAAGQAGQLPEQLPELVQDRRGVVGGAHRVLIVAHRNSCV